MVDAFRGQTDVDQAIVKARGVLRALSQMAHRSRVLEPIVHWISRQLALLAQALRRGSISTADFIDESRQVMEHGYQLVTTSASQHAADSHPDTSASEWETLSGELADEQAGYLMRLMPVVLASDDWDSLVDRLNQYTDSLVHAYNEAYGKTVQNGHPDYEIVWHLGDTEHCALCLARDGHSYTFATLPGYPGDGGFGGPICEGGPRCGCWLEYREGGETVAMAGNVGREQAGSNAEAQNQRARERRQSAQEARDAWIDSLPDVSPAPGQPSAQVRARTIEGLRRELASLLNQRIRESGGYQGVSVEPQDIPARVIAQLLPPEMQGPYKPPQITMDEAVRQLFTGKVVTLDMTKDDFTWLVLNAVEDIAKSEKTPYYSVTHHPLGHEGLWHYEGLQLPAYIQNVAKGIMESGHSREEAIPMAINAIKRWARGEGNVHPEVRSAARKALAEWDELKATHNKTKEGR